MNDDEIRSRFLRAKVDLHTFPEAYCLVTYVSVDGCKIEAWNPRDDYVDSIIKHDGIVYKSINKPFRYELGYVLKPGDYFIDEDYTVSQFTQKHLNAGLYPPRGLSDFVCFKYVDMKRDFLFGMDGDVQFVHNPTSFFIPDEVSGHKLYKVCGVQPYKELIVGDYVIEILNGKPEITRVDKQYLESQTELE